MLLEIKDLHASVAGKKILDGLSLSIKSGELHALMGPNGSGKTTLANAIMGSPKVNIEKGSILVDGKNILGMKPEERARLGLFVQFQNPIEIEGVSLIQFLRTAKEALSKESIDFKRFMSDIKNNMKFLEMSEEFINRPVNAGLSGGEKKKSEILQLMLLKPRIAILDEPDSGLDVDALKVVAKGLQKVKEENVGMLVITHYSRIFSYLKPEFVHIMMNGRIVKEGDYELVKVLENEGYEAFG